MSLGFHGIKETTNYVKANIEINLSWFSFSEIEKILQNNDYKNYCVKE